MLEPLPGLFFNWYWIGVYSDTTTHSSWLTASSSSPATMTDITNGKHNQSLTSHLHRQSMAARQCRQRALLRSWNETYSTIKSLNVNLAKCLLREWQGLKIEDINLGGLSIGILK